MSVVRETIEAAPSITAQQDSPARQPSTTITGENEEQE
jgi:hypothetical protein